MTPNSRFLELLRDIEPSTTTKHNSARAHSSVRDALKGDGKFGPRAERIFLGGSYRRDTAIRPRQKNGSLDRPDIDIYVVVDVAPYETTPSDEVEALYAALDRTRQTLGITKLKRNRVSLSISMHRADLDVSVLLERQFDNLYRIGNRETEEWYRTDPEAHTSWSSEQNARFSGRFKPMTKLVKWARRENPTRYKHPKSFVIESFLAANLDKIETHYGSCSTPIAERSWMPISPNACWALAHGLMIQQFLDRISLRVLAGLTLVRITTRSKGIGMTLLWPSQRRIRTKQRRIGDAFSDLVSLHLNRPMRRC